MKIDEFKALQEKQKTRRKPRHIESIIQKDCVKWFRGTYDNYLILSIPNGGARSRIEAAILKGEGALAGASDLMVIAKRAVLFVEVKKDKGKQQESQKVFQANVERLGHTYCIIHSLQEFQLTIQRWLKEITMVKFKD